MKRKTDRREAVKILGGLIVAGAGLAVPSLALAGKAPGRKRSRPGAPVRSVPTAPPNPPAVHCAEDHAPAARPPAPQQDVVTQLLSPYRIGSRMGPLTVLAISGVSMGAASITLGQLDGSSFQVDITRADRTLGALEPVASTGEYDLYLANGGTGHKPTGARLDRIMNHLARVMASNQTRTPRLKMLTLGQRLRRYPDGRFDARP